MIFLGIDAGGSKALFSLCDENGRVISSLQRPGFIPDERKFHGVRDKLRDDIGKMLRVECYAFESFP